MVGMCPLASPDVNR